MKKCYNLLKMSCRLAGSSVSEELSSSYFIWFSVTLCTAAALPKPNTDQKLALVIMQYVTRSRKTYLPRCELK